MNRRTFTSRGKPRAAKFWLSPVRQAYSYGFAANELTRIEGLVQEHEAGLLKAWHEYFKPNDRSRNN